MSEPYYAAEGVALYLGDCIEAMAALPEASVDAIVTDPPYGLEFMGKTWDRFRSDDPGTNRNRGERVGAQGEAGAGDGTHPARASVAVAYGVGVKPKTSRCTGCGKRDQWRNDHDCTPHARWVSESIDPFAAPPTSLAYENWTREWAREALRVLKPGGHLVAFGGTRTSHRLVSGLEDAGFEIRDALVWLFGSGFPKSLDVGKAIDKAAGIEPSRVEDNETASLGGFGDVGWNPTLRRLYYDEPTDAAREHEGQGTALKPGHEPIVLARKPLVGTVAANVLEYGTGALNIDAARIDAPDNVGKVWTRGGNQRGASLTTNTSGEHQYVEADPGGRWPTNVVLDPEAAAMLDAQVGELTSGALGPQHTDRGKAVGVLGAFTGRIITQSFGGDTGGPSRFYYCAKASRGEREFGLWDLPLRRRADAESRDDDAPGSSNPRLRVSERRNDHPTVKPIALMRWLVRLIVPPGGVLLDPFVGSGTTGIAALLEDASVIGIDQDQHYLEIAWRRIARRHLLDDHPDPAERTDATGQLPMQL